MLKHKLKSSRNITVHAFCSLVLFVLSALNCVTTHAQHVLSHFEIPEQAQAGYEYLINDQNDNLYLGFRVATWLPAVLGDTTLFGHRYDTAAGLGLSDFHLVKYDTEYDLKASFVIDNAEWIRDFYATEDNAFVSLTLVEYEREDSLYPIILGGELEIEREGNRGKGVLVVLDTDLNLVKAVIPGTGELGQVAADGRYAYLELRIPDFEPYILIGDDTIFNWELNIPGFPDYGYQTIVLCKYDFINEEVVWTRRIGNVGPEHLRDMLIDSEGNLLIHGWTSSGYFTFTETDTALNYQEYKPFLVKYAPNGEFLWGVLNTNQHGEHFHSIENGRRGQCVLSRRVHMA